jgi:uncharacterized spore protein YtfJ
MATVEEAMEAASSTVRGGPGGFLADLVGRAGGAATARAVFGEPVTQGGTTVIPVARVRWAAGGGAGEGVNDGERTAGSGGGGGGAGTASPAGFIIVREGEARFVHIARPADVVPLVIAGTLSAILLLRALRGLFR